MPQRIFGGPGFIVQDLAIATGGAVVPDVVYNVAAPTPKKAGIQDTLAAMYGRDLVYTEGDLVVTGSGDLERTTGLGALRASFLRSLAIAPGDIFWRPEYGVGIVEFLNKAATAGNLHEIKNRIASTLGSDPAVDRLSRNEVQMNDQLGLIEVFVDVVVAGQEASLALGIQRA